MGSADGVESIFGLRARRAFGFVSEAAGDISASPDMAGCITSSIAGAGSARRRRVTDFGAALRVVAEARAGVRDVAVFRAGAAAREEAAVLRVAAAGLRAVAVLRAEAAVRVAAA